MKKILVTVGMAIALAGCASNYTFNGKLYKSAGEFHNAVNETYSSAVAGITPLPSPVTSRRLAVVFPSVPTIAAASQRNFTNMKGSAPPPMVVEQFQNLAMAANRSARAYYESAERRHIYPAVRFVEADSPTPNPTSSADEDALFYSEPSLGSGTWYYATAKGGKQVFAYDKAHPTVGERMKAFADALQLQALRD